MSIPKVSAQPTDSAKAEAARQAQVAQQEFRRCILLSRDMIKNELARLTGIFQREVEPAVNALAQADFTENIPVSVSELLGVERDLNGPMDHLVSDNPENAYLIVRTARDIQGLVAGLRASLADSQRILDASRQQERERLQRAAAYQQSKAEEDELHRRRLAGEAV